jgi:hypothetical protein
MQTPSEEAEKVATIATAASSGSDAMLFAGVWLIASFSAVARFTRDNDFRSCAQLISGSASSGFLAFAVVAILRHYLQWDGAADMLCLGVAALIGGLGKEQEKIRQWAIRRIFGVDSKNDSQ